MKRLVFASIAILLTMGIAEAGIFRRNGNGNCGGCPIARRACATACAVAPAAQGCEEAPPTCYKTIEEPKTIMVKRQITVPARRIEIKRPDIITYVEQPCQYRRIKQCPVPRPDIIEEVPVPPIVKRTPQCPLVRYECPTDCDDRG